jgi:hypothetical protein
MIYPVARPTQSQPQTQPVQPPPGPQYGYVAPRTQQPGSSNPYRYNTRPAPPKYGPGGLYDRTGGVRVPNRR